jgi:hypothetical protein
MTYATAPDAVGRTKGRFLNSSPGVGQIAGKHWRKRSFPADFVEKLLFRGI